jgi:hypothetical protein
MHRVAIIALRRTGIACFDKLAMLAGCILFRSFFMAVCAVHIFDAAGGMFFSFNTRMTVNTCFIAMRRPEKSLLVDKQAVYLAGRLLLCQVLILMAGKAVVDILRAALPDSAEGKGHAHTDKNRYCQFDMAVFFHGRLTPSHLKQIQQYPGS